MHAYTHTHSNRLRQEKGERKEWGLLKLLSLAAKKIRSWRARRRPTASLSLSPLASCVRPMHGARQEEERRRISGFLLRMRQSLEYGLRCRSVTDKRECSEMDLVELCEVQALG